ncbi:hypothetical protein ABZ318_21240 [Streptomyces sp. NPDC006197]|uniref:hypothetical protein n=1 Tax=Streptomyces sp. NPDC006197 TaxID=3156685 RepID=UPI0033AE815E
MESGEPVTLTVSTTMKRLTKLAFIAQQFGYEYADLKLGSGGSCVMWLVPDPSPQARALAAENRARYPHASDGVSLPSYAPDALELLKARMTLDLKRQYSTGKRLALIFAFLALAAAGIGSEYGDNAIDALTIAGVFLAATAAPVPVGFAISRRFVVRYTARLEAAGFTPVTDRNGRLRYVPPGGQLPGHGNPFAG